jgi:hypothetical protein
MRLHEVCILFRSCLILNPNINCSATRLPDTEGSQTADILPRRAELRYIVYTWDRWSCRWLSVIPVLFAALDERVEDAAS